MRRLFTAMLLMGAASVATAAIGVVNRKLLAIYVGPDGMGALDQLVDLNVLLINLVSFGLGDGIIKYVSEFHSSDNPDRLRDFLASVGLVLSGLAIAVAGVLVFFAGDISQALLRSPQYAGLVVLLVLTLPCSVLTLVLRSAVNGYRQVRYLALMSVLPALSILVLAWPLVATWHLLGAILNIAISTGLTLAVAVYFFVRAAGGAFVKSIVRAGHFRPRMLRMIAGFGVVSLIGGVASTQTLIWVRIFINNRAGLAAVGLFSVVNGLSEQTLNLALIALSSYSYAHISAMRDPQDIARELNNTLRIVVLLGVAMLFVLSVFRGLIIPLLFSSAFLGAAALIPLQVVGDFLKILMWSLSLPQLPMGRTRAWLAYWLVWCGSFVGLSYVFINLYGLMGVVYAHVAAHALGVVLLYLDQRRVLALRLAPGTPKLLVSSLVLLGSVVVFNGEGWYTYPLFLLELGLWAALNITRGERLAGIRYAQSWVPRLRGALAAARH